HPGRAVEASSFHCVYGDFTMAFSIGLARAGRGRSTFVVRQRYLALALTAFVSVTHAEPLQLKEVIHQALAGQPSLQGMEQAALAAREAAVADAQLPDPKLRFGVQNLPVTGSDALDPAAS